MTEDKQLLTFLDWVSTGSSATALVLFLYIPTISLGDAGIKTLSAHAFLLSLPFLVGSIFLSKQFILLKHNELAARIHFIILLVGTLLFILGFALLCWAIDISYLVTFTMGTGLVGVITNIAVNTIYK